MSDTFDAPALARLGWDDRLAAALAALPGEPVPARLARVGGRTAVALDPQERRVAVSPRLLAGPGMPEGGPTVGDWVALRGDLAVAVLPRRSVLLRRAAGGVTAAQAVAANVDLVLITVPLGAEVRGRRLERTLTLAWASGATPVVVLTKADIADDPEADVAAAVRVAAGAEVLALSAVDGRGVDRVRALLRPGVTAGLVGPSGSGKSTLANLLAGRHLLATAAVRGDGRGRHTTTHRELVALPGGAHLVDTPGMRELGLWDAREGIAQVFGDITALAASCRFRDCRHDREPGCAVRAAAEADPEVAGRLRSHRKLEREQRRLEAEQDGRALAEARRALRRRMRRYRALGPHR